MIKVKIQSSTGFGKTAEFAGINLNQYDLATKYASVTLFLFEDSVNMQPILNRTVYLSPAEIENWGLDDFVLVDLVLEKEGFVRDTTYVEPTTTMFVEPEIIETTTTTTVEETTTTTTTVSE